eukprot:CAMPEP_0179626456 /NCGR_PEP_ID=MMETSP0932-20121108/3825_1 /TAXON_ID=548131 ORGANISM="Ostreococcus mediterraneus, Strain clade-D-RCC2596" /NCGR_SAMPLE_ID=MMETSP0932 /ASSEMBLY_ACC=CAM_ASM_000582 /LENGTH=78 /DNA_ID=CAMNT_0021495753 /DNA_START=40 /DNA_END=275 /DNA_ORIENTATION=-
MPLFDSSCVQQMHTTSAAPYQRMVRLCIARRTHVVKTNAASVALAIRGPRRALRRRQRAPERLQPHSHSSTDSAPSDN